MALELGRSLLLSDAVSPHKLAEALFVHVTEKVSLVQALFAVNAITKERLEEELARADAPVVRQVAPAPSLLSELPARFSERVLAFPLRRDEHTGIIDVAAIDARDVHGLEELSFWLKAPVRVSRATVDVVSALVPQLAAAVAVERLSAAPIVVPPAAEHRVVADTPSYGVHAADEPLGARPLQHSSPELDSTIVLELRRPKSVYPEAAAKSQSTAPPGAKSAPPRAKSTRPPAARNSTRANAAQTTDLGPVLRAMRTATDRDRVLNLLLEGCAIIAPKAAIFVIKKDRFAGWTCTARFGDASALRHIDIPTSSPTVLALALVLASTAQIVKLDASEAHAPIRAVMKEPASEVAVAAIKVQTRPALVLMADGFADPGEALGRIGELAHAAGDALSRILREKRKGHSA